MDISAVKRVKCRLTYLALLGKSVRAARYCLKDVKKPLH